MKLATMRQLSLIIPLITRTLADKADPIYQSTVKEDKIFDYKDTLYASYQYVPSTAPAPDGHESPAALLQYSYKSPSISAQYGYPSPQKVTAIDSAGLTKTDPEGYYYIKDTTENYYDFNPVAISHSPDSSYGENHKTDRAPRLFERSCGDSRDICWPAWAWILVFGAAAFGSLLPLLLGGGLLFVILYALYSYFEASSVLEHLGDRQRSFVDEASIFTTIVPIANELTVSVFNAIKIYAQLNEVTEEKYI